MQLDAELEQLLPGLTASLAACADPSGAPPLAANVLAAARAADSARLGDLAVQRGEVLRCCLACICGAAPFLARILAARPALFFQLGEDDFGAVRGARAYVERLEAALAGVAADDEVAALRLFKYAELARITVRDLSPDLVPFERTDETLAELSHLADALLSRALGSARRNVRAALGAPLWQTVDGAPFEPRFAVLGLGKLGGEELNYSSDVDLVYVHETPPSGLSRGPGGLSPREYFTRVGQEFGRLVSTTKAEGFLYRVDLDLRPEGAAGPLVISAAEMASYYDLWAATWEKAAFAKARPVAGEHDFGWAAIRAIDPMIYRSSMDFAAVAAIREMKDKIEKASGRAAHAFDLKIGSGGIRDIEFVAQALQLLHGGRIPQVRDRSTQRTLTRLAQVGLLSDGDAADLLAAYRFLRRAENRVQMVGERQVHRVPNDRAELVRLAHAMLFDDVTAFEGELLAHRQRVQQVFDSVLPVTGSSRVLALFQRHAPQILANPMMRARIEDLATRFAQAIESGPCRERAMNNLDRFIEGVGSRSFYYGLLLDRPELVPRLASLFAASEYLSGYLASHPRLVEPIFSDPSVLLLTRAEMERELEEIRAEMEATDGRDQIEIELDALRLFHNRELINIGLLDLSEKVDHTEASSSLTDLAETCVDRALELARSEIWRQREASGKGGAPAEMHGEFLVVGMGKLASRELTYGSDLDVIFVYDLPGASADELVAGQEYFVRLAQKFIWALQTRTREGVSYQIDARLRPSGNQGTLVTSLSGFRRYHSQSAAIWERQALLRARPIAGGATLADGFAAARLEILRLPLAADPAAEIRRIRGRVESELAQETDLRHDFKTGRGGLMDIECVVQYLQLRHGGQQTELFEVDRTAGHIDRLERLGLLPSADAAALRGGWDFLQRLSSRLRIVENRSISDLDEERGDLQFVALQLGYDSRRPSGARRALLDDYRRHTAAVRDVYQRVLDDAGGRGSAGRQ